MAKNEKKYPDFECTEYEYGDLSQREYYGSITGTFKFDDSVEILFRFYFKDFLDFHKRKKTDLHRIIERIYAKMRGWGSRHYGLIKKLQEEDDVDMFQEFANYAVQNEEDELIERYEATKRAVAEYLLRTEKEIENKNEHVNDSDTIKDTEINTDDELIFEKPVEAEVVSDDDTFDDDDDDIFIKEEEEEAFDEEEDDDDEEITDENESEVVVEEKEEEDDDEESPYDRDRKKFKEMLELATDDMYEALKTNFFPQMDYFQRRYPSRWKKLIENIEYLLQNFEEELQNEMLPHLDESEYREFDIRFNSQKADTAEDEPPTAR